MTLGFAVRPYSLQNLKELLGQRSPIPSYVLDAKQHLHYLDSYFHHPDINAQTIVVEFEYIDRDFLLDYAGYYVRCFSQYHRWCSRFHFFSNPFTDAHFEEYLRLGTTANLTSQILQDNYRGFLVAKPLPETILGRTCLKTYNTQQDRHFPFVRDYDVSLFGTKLTVKSLAFQEQDTVAAACATSALWTAFQGTGLLFQHEIPSPMTITKSAIERSPTESRAFPAAEGLTDLQMAEGVRGVGLDPLILPADSNWKLKAASYSYLKAGIPVIMNCLVGDHSKHNQVLDPDDDLFGHAITLVGFRMNDASPVVPGPGQILLRSSKLERLYSHDDQVGPFARMEFPATTVSITNPNNPAQPFVYDWVSCTWGTAANPDGRIYISEKVLIPLVTTIRIPLDTILITLFFFDQALEALRQNQISAFGQRQAWDVYLISANKLKDEWFNYDPTTLPDLRKELALTPLPKFVWRITAIDGVTKQTDFLFDPTDIEQGPMLIKVVGYDNAHFTELLRVSDVYSNDPQYAQDLLQPHGKIWEHLRMLFQQAQQNQQAPNP